jgi:hypothetical protein
MELQPVSIKPGTIYILRNSSYRGTVVKIGRTTRAPEDRAAEVSGHTGVPEPFEVLYEEQVADCELAERLIHGELVDYRIRQRREFFNVPLKHAVRAVFRVCLRVNQHLLRENSRLALVLKLNERLPDLGQIIHGADSGTTAIRLVLRRKTAIAEIDLGPSAMVTCTPELLAMLKRRPEFEEVALYVPTELSCAAG